VIGDSAYTGNAENTGTGDSDAGRESSTAASTAGRTDASTAGRDVASTASTADSDVASTAGRSNASTAGRASTPAGRDSSATPGNRRVTARTMLAGRVVIVTGAGRGLGRAHALELARHGASVVVNDLDVTVDGSKIDTGTSSAAQHVVAEIVSAGGTALANHEDVADWEGSARLMEAALNAFGRLDAVVNNAGVVRDRMFVNATPDEWDTVLRVHLRGHFCVARRAAAYWRDETRKGRQLSGRIVNTSSGAGLLGSMGQAAYSAAKAGIVGLTLVQAAELGRYGVTANAIAPAARTRMTETLFAGAMARPEQPGAFDAMAPENVSPLVAWLCSLASAAISGKVFEIGGGRLTLMDGWQEAATIDSGHRLNMDEIGPLLDKLVREAPEPLPVYGT
jgi:NAD(P)-dependent dehydrogenase (short-subunit alcohol dehydrogenase family)